MSPTSYTICAPATSVGGAIAIVRLSGPDAVHIANKVFSKDISEAKGYTLHYGEIDQLDDVLVTVFRKPHSYTGEDSVEISCHASPFIVQSLVKRLIEHGAKMAKPGEFTQRAFLAGKMDLTQAEAVADLIASRNSAQHRVSMSQMRGGISNKLRQLREQLVQMTSLLELELDFSEEDVEFADRQKLICLAEEIDMEIVRLSSSFNAGNAIKNGIPVAIIGAPNVGKSTLLNLLLNEERAIVSNIEGTTRDIIEDTIYVSSPYNKVQGATFRFIDTAGIRSTDDTIERMGIERGLKAAEKAQIILLISEPSVPFPDIPCRPDQTVIRILNKSESFQAINGTGLNDLIQSLLDAVPTSMNDEVLVTNIRHKQALDLSHDDISRALLSLRSDRSGDIVSEDLRQCLFHLADIIGGQINTDEILNNIFKNFCIGK